MEAYELKYTAEEIDGILKSVDEKTIYGDATQSEHGLMSTTDKAKLDSLPTSQQIDTSLSGKVDKENGKGLSTNDYDATAKGKVDAIPQNPQYTDTVYDDTALSGRVSTIEGKESGWDAKQDALVSGTNIKTVNGESLLGGGNIEIQGGGGEENVIEAITMNDAPVPVTNKTAVITETDPTVPSWAKQQNKPSYNYSEIGNTPDLSGFITKSVNDLTNYYLKSETYTKDEVAALIGAIQNFHYEFYASISAVTNPQGNVLYLIGPTGTGSDKYEEYVYSNNDWHKIGDTSIDLSGYVTTSALNTALADYTTTANLTTLLAGKQDTISDLATIRSGASLGATAYQKPSTGIPASDLASGVIPTVPVQDVTVGGTSVVSNGTAAIPAIPDTSDFEESANKVSTIVGNETNETKYSSTKAVADALGKRGVISQTQTWSGTGDQPRTYVMSNLVYGTIPQANIDLFESAGATFNATSGYFELNGLTDISYVEMQKIYNCSIVAATYPVSRSMAFVNAPIRCTLPLKKMTSFSTNFSYMCYGTNEIEQVNIEQSYISATSGLTSAFQNAYCLKKIGNGYIDYIGGANDNAFKNCYSLETVYLRKLKANMKFMESPNLSMESIAYMVENAGTDNITITLHPTAYDAAIANADVTAALQTKTNVSLASA